jgi:hypothetical protein
MQKWITLLMTLLVGSSVSYANANSGQVSFEAGYRHDNLRATNRIPASDPFLETHAKFKDVDIFQIGLRASTTLCSNLYLRANAYWGWVLDGDFKNNISVFPGSYGFDDNSGFNCEIGRRDRFVINNRWVYGAAGAIGYPFFFCDCTTMLAPVIGYAIDEQNLEVDSPGFGFGNYDCDFFPVSDGCCCRNKHIFRWYGPFVGVDFSYRPACECWDLWAEFEYHWGSFQLKRNHRGFSYGDNWNHSSRNAHGWVVAVGADYDFCNCWTLGFSLKFQDWRAHKRHHHHFFESSYSSGSGERARNHFKWDSYAINLTIGRNF